MGRNKLIDRPRKFEIKLPDSIFTKVHQELYSEIEGKVPYGAISALGTQLFTAWLRERGALM